MGTDRLRFSRNYSGSSHKKIDDIETLLPSYEGDSSGGCFIQSNNVNNSSKLDESGPETLTSDHDHTIDGIPDLLDPDSQWLELPNISSLIEYPEFFPEEGKHPDVLLTTLYDYYYYRGRLNMWAEHSTLFFSHCFTVWFLFAVVLLFVSLIGCSLHGFESSFCQLRTYASDIAFTTFGPYIGGIIVMLASWSYSYRLCLLAGKAKLHNAAAKIYKSIGIDCERLDYISWSFVINQLKHAHKPDQSISSNSHQMDEQHNILHSFVDEAWSKSIITRRHNIITCLLRRRIINLDCVLSKKCLASCLCSCCSCCTGGGHLSFSCSCCDKRRQPIPKKKLMLNDHDLTQRIFQSYGNEKSFASQYYWFYDDLPDFSSLVSNSFEHSTTEVRLSNFLRDSTDMIGPSGRVSTAGTSVDSNGSQVNNACACLSSPRLNSKDRVPIDLFAPHSSQGVYLNKTINYVLDRVILETVFTDYAKGEVGTVLVSLITKLYNRTVNIDNFDRFQDVHYTTAVKFDAQDVSAIRKNIRYLQYHVTMLGFLLILCIIPLILYQIFYFIAQNIYCFLKDLSLLSTKSWTLYSHLLLRHMGELKHESEERLKRASPLVDLYQKQAAVPCWLRLIHLTMYLGACCITVALVYKLSPLEVFFEPSQQTVVFIVLLVCGTALSGLRPLTLNYNDSLTGEDIGVCCICQATKAIAQESLIRYTYEALKNIIKKSNIWRQQTVPNPTLISDCEQDLYIDTLIDLHPKSTNRHRPHLIWLKLMTILQLDLRTLLHASKRYAYNWLSFLYRGNLSSLYVVSLRIFITNPIFWLWSTSPAVMVIFNLLGY